MAETDIPTTYKQIVKFGLDKDGFFGLICSSDNGKTVKLIVGPDGLVLHPEDGDKIWNLIESKVQSAIDASGSQLTWSKINDKPDLVLEKDLPDFNQFAKKNELPDTSGLAKAATVDAVKTTAESALSTAEKAQSTADANTKALANKIDRNELPVIPTDLVHTAEMEQVKANIAKTQQIANDAVALANNVRTTINANDELTVKKPSEYSEGFSHELKRVAVMIPDRSDLIESAQAGTIGILSTVSYGGYAHQTLKVLDSQRPMTFIRNGSVDTWYPWETVTTTITVD